MVRWRGLREKFRRAKCIGGRARTLTNDDVDTTLPSAQVFYEIGDYGEDWESVALAGRPVLLRPEACFQSRLLPRQNHFLRIRRAGG